MADIELVIKMPEEMWERVKEGYVPLGIRKYLMNSAPLPKEHGRLIDEKDLSLMTVHMIDGMFVCDAPTIIEAESEDKE